MGQLQVVGCPEEGCLLAEFQQERLFCLPPVTEKCELAPEGNPFLLSSLTSSVWLRVQTEAPFGSHRRQLWPHEQGVSRRILGSSEIKGKAGQAGLGQWELWA